ncbi:MAG: T9SS type A sorting domain-containing protein [bacterium]|nr:T9SS type A sorting domain-containing protein [bacterium]
MLNEVIKSSLATAIRDFYPKLVGRKSASGGRNMFKLCFCVSVFLFGSLLRAEGYQIAWLDTIDNGNEDVANGVAIDKNNNILVTGYSKINGEYDFFTVKYDSGGNVLWRDTINNGGEDKASGIAIDRSGNIIIVGTSYINGSLDYFIVKYDSARNVLWKDTVNKGDTCYATAVAVDKWNNIVVTGYSYANWKTGCLTVKYDSAGNILWADTISDSTNNRAYGVAIDNSGNIVITGSIYGGSINTAHFFTMKYSQNGNVLWDNIYPVNDNPGSDCSACGIAIDSTQNIIITGSYVPGTSMYWDWVTIKYDSLGNLLWTDTLNSGLADIAQSVAIDDNDNIIITGFCAPTYDVVYDVLTIKYDSSGNILWGDTIAIKRFDYGNAVVIDKSGNIIIAGSTCNNEWDPDYLIFKYASFQGVESPSNPQSAFQNPNLSVSQNPFSKSTIISFSVGNSRDCSLQIYDLSGRLVKTLINEQKPAGTYSTTLSANDLKTGIYFVRLTAGNTKLTKKLILMK